MSKPNSPILPVHAQDVIVPPREEGVVSPPRTARTERTNNNVHWSVPNTPYSPRTIHTTYTARTSGTGRSTVVETLADVVDQLEQQNAANVWDAEEPEPEAKYQASLHSGKSGHTTRTGKSGHSKASHAPSTFMGKVQHFRHHMRHWLHNDKFHYTIIGLVILDLIAVFLDLTLSLLTLSCYTDDQLDFFASHGILNPPESLSCVLHESTALTGADWFLWALSVFLLCIFTLEIFASFFAFGLSHFYKPLYAIDALVVFASLIMEVFFKFADNGKSGSSPAALIVLRLWKIIRAIHAIAHSIELKNQSIINSVKQAMAESQAETAQLYGKLERTELRVDYLKPLCPNLNNDEMESFVDQELEKRRAIEEAEEAAEEEESSTASEKGGEKPKEMV
ncbi:hypothetical protein DACRYDRAFT_24849 [Dacryopinax primogenitus]|uniref:Voltage-gated hydrogen channel 1 n=1 Tax=Dacryopinax primogenitus (strain DJM 731) TaxID=1858805 RepID=M5G2D3_DACPD|nr:uncharacterized protein DACRYDRAFT_24849 [Dacryopinax primogenitus]EJT97927.1 hypothetical protein DACRYDRAFT_24849 [Dacryopinax primogenitus]